MNSPALHVHGVETRIRACGLRFVAALHAAMQARKFYPGDNAAVTTALADLQAAAAEMLEEESSIDLRVANGCLFVNHTRMPVSLASFATFGVIDRALSRFDIAAIVASAGVQRHEWIPLLDALVLPARHRGYAEMEKALNRAPHPHLTVKREVQAMAPTERNDQAKRVYLRSVQVARELMTSVRVGHAVNARRVKRSVQAMVDQVLTNQAALVGMTTMREFDEYTFAHSINVCILCIVFGQKLGLDKQQLYELGLCGLLHDLGKMRIDWRVINKPGKLNDIEWAVMRLHPAEGLMSMFEIHGFNDPPFRQMLAAYEHHMKVSLSGYPQVRRERRPTMFSRVVSIVDTFDAVTSVRSYRAKPWPPDQVLRAMRDDPAWGLDPVLVRAFINATGIYPVGTVVELSNHCIAVVAEQNFDRLYEPVVRVVRTAQGAYLDAPQTLDLSEPGPVDASPISITRSVDAATLGIDVSQVLVPAEAV